MFGTVFTDIEVISLTKSDMINGIGKFVAETNREENDSLEWSNYNDRGVYIFQSNNNPNIAYRIYKEYADHDFSGYMDDEMIQKFTKVKDKIKLSKLPTALITMDGKIVGQEIAYFPNAVTLLEFSRKNRNINYQTKIYLDVLKILEELYHNGIIYLDCNPSNFLINFDNDELKVEIIDFDPIFIKYSNHNNTALTHMLHNYRSMIDCLNHNFEIKDIVGSVSITEDFDSTIFELDKISKKLCLR